MTKPPRPRDERLLTWSLLTRAYGFLGVIEGIFSLAAYFFVYLLEGWRPSMGISAMATSGTIYVMATTACHHTIVTTQMGNGFAFRTERESIFKVGFFTNTFYLWALLSEAIILVIFVYVPPFPSFFGFAPVSWEVWLFMYACAPVCLVADEIRKAILRSYEARPDRTTSNGSDERLEQAA